MRITKDQLRGVDQYKYSGIDKSVVSKHVLGPFWTWLVTLFPRNLAPNAVSLPSSCALPLGDEICSFSSSFVTVELKFDETTAEARGRRSLPANVSRLHS